ncbi:MAG TPA: Vps62-related protein [Solirubrobacteraceae bacterium]|nr:Vps62-related protein [Solirubrobacteraceae bacterium]
MTALLAALALLGPVVVHDSREASPLGSVGARPGEFARPPVVYERSVGRWRQWWLAFARNDQDRGIVRTGRHAGDWEMVQIRLDAAGVPVEAVFAQHSGAERCPWREVETRGGRPVIYLASGSHAAYFRPGVRDRMWPDPNDEADGRGAVVAPPVRPLGAWSRWPGRWGGARAGWVPGEMDSPRGPRFQPQGRWSDPGAWARSARPCTMGRCDARGECDGPEMLVSVGAPVLVVVLLGGWWWRRRTSTAAG